MLTSEGTLDSPAFHQVQGSHCSTIDNASAPALVDDDEVLPAVSDLDATGVSRIQKVHRSRALPTLDFDCNNFAHVDTTTVHQNRRVGCILHGGVRSCLQKNAAAAHEQNEQNSTALCSSTCHLRPTTISSAPHTFPLLALENDQTQLILILL
jgi:hypothetical protein